MTYIPDPTSPKPLLHWRLTLDQQARIHRGEIIEEEIREQAIADGKLDPERERREREVLNKWFTNTYPAYTAARTGL